MSIPVRIGIDMAAAAGQKSGLGFYVHNLVSNMEQVHAPVELVRIERVKKNLRTPSRILWDQIGLPVATMGKKLDVLFVPAFSAPRFSKPVVMTAHDIFGVLHPERFSQPAKWYWSGLLPRSMKRANHLIAVSAYTKKTIVEQLGIDEKKISVVPLSAGEEFRVLEDVAWIQNQLKELHITTPFILSVGTLEPRKNFERLVEAYAWSQRGDAKLVIVGKKGWDYDGIFQKIRKYHLEDSVQIVDYVSQEQLVALYNACLFFVMPSIFEGFGLPALEAMRCAAPVAVAQNTSLPEVIGEAGMLFDPYDIESIRARLDILFTDEKMRHTMQQKSFARAQEFSWKRTATQTLDIIQRVAQHTS